MANIQKVNRGDWPKAETINKIIDELARLAKLSGDSAIGVKNDSTGVTVYLKQPVQKFIGLIVDTGPNGDEDDYSDARYWVSRAFCDNAEADDDATIISFAEQTKPGDGEPANPLYKVVTATNLAELKSNSHNLLVGVPVEVQAVYDVGVPSKIRYYFNVGGAALPMFIKITASALVDGASNRWKYSWIEQRLVADGTWQDKPQGKTSANTGIFAYNSIEANNGATGIQGNSVDLGNVAAGFILQPVRGNPVVQAWELYNCQTPREKEITFAYENAIDGTCG